MQFLISLPLPEDQDPRRERILSAIVGQLEIESDAAVIARTVGVRRGTRTKGKREVLCQVALEVGSPDDPEHALELAMNAEEAGQAALRGLRLPNIACRVYVVADARALAPSET